MGADVPLQVKRVVEALPTVGAEVSLDVVVTLHVAIKHALVGEGLLADVAGEEVSTGTVPQGHLWVRMVFVKDIQELGLQVGRLGGRKHEPPGKLCPPARGHTSVPLAHGQQRWWGTKEPLGLGSASCGSPSPPSGLLPSPFATSTNGQLTT